MASNSTRRKGRECALQILYLLDVQERTQGGQLDGNAVESAIKTFFTNFDGPAEVASFTRLLVLGAWKERDTIDTEIANASAHWKLSRMDFVDRNVIRLATYELKFSPQLKKAIILDEAIEIAKRFGSERSAAFVNGVVDAVANKVRKED
jgi:N utilization substance protein B